MIAFTMLRYDVTLTSRHFVSHFFAFNNATRDIARRCFALIRHVTLIWLPLRCHADKRYADMPPHIAAMRRYELCALLYEPRAPCAAAALCYGV